MTFTVVVATSIGWIACDESTPRALGPTTGSETDASAPINGNVDAGEVDAPTPEESIELKFEGRVGNEPFSCTRTYDGFGTTNATVTPGDLRFFVHDVALVRRGSSEAVPVTLDANDWQNPNPQVALIDFEDHRGTCTSGTDGMNDVIVGKVRAGDYDGLRFTIGVPHVLNHVNVATAAPPLPASKLQWTWLNGFLHLSFEFRSTKMDSLGDGGVRAMDPFYAHIGSTDCSGDVATGGIVCLRSNRPKVSLSGFNPKTSKIIVDAKQLYAGSNLDANAQGTVPGCMAATTDLDCSPMFERLGLDFTTGAANGTSPAAFSVGAR